MRVRGYNIYLLVGAVLYLKRRPCDEESELRGQEPNRLGQGGVLVLDAVGLVDQEVAPSVPSRNRRGHTHTDRRTEGSRGGTGPDGGTRRRF